MMIGIADAIVMAPVLASACSTPTEAEDDWIIAVNTAPASTPRIGFENRSSRLRKLSLVRSGETAPLIASMPYIKTAKPSRIEPVSFCRSLPAMMRTMPTSARTGVNDEGLSSWMKRLDPSRPAKLKSHAVTVVPTFAPMITWIACLSVIRPEFTKTTTMTVVADDDWMTAVTPRPVKKPASLLPVSFPSSALS